LGSVKARQVSNWSAMVFSIKSIWLATFRRKIAAGGADVGIAAFAENCKVGRI
jgi:hypothetical protein